MKILILLLIPMLLTTCSKSEEPRLSPKEIKLSAEQVQIVDGGNRFGFDLFRQLINPDEPGENVFFSPLSVHMALAMAWNGAATSTRIQITEAMYFPDIPDQQINEGYRRLMADLLSVDKKVAMDIANSVWYRQGFSVKNDFLNLNRDYFDADVSELDFSDPKARDIINAWVAAATRNSIEEIVDEIAPDHVMFLINAIYFKGIWQTEFDKKKTVARPFMLYDGSQKDVMTMEMTADFAYTAREGYRVIELPYGRGNFSMLVFLPEPGSNVNELIENLDWEQWNSLAAELSFKREINVRLPRFEFSYETELKQPLMNLGIQKAFIPYQADFSGITDEEIYISRVRHKSFVEVNEEGTEAAVVTSIEFREMSISEPFTFYVNRPFVFALKEKYTNSMLFIGRVMNPDE